MNECEPNRVLADAIRAGEAQRWPGAGEVRFTTAENEGTKVQLILIDKTEVSKTRR